MFKKFITGIMAGIIVIAVVMTAGCVSSTIVTDDEIEQIEEQAPVEIVCAQDTVEEPVWFVTISGGDNQEITTPSESEVEKEPDHGKPRRIRSQNEGFGINEEVSPNIHFKKPSHAIVTSTCVKSEVNHRVWEDPVWEDPGHQYQGIEPTRTKAWFGINEPVEGAGLEGDPWLYELPQESEAHLQPLETNSSESEEFPEAPELNEQPKEKKDQSVKFPGHLFKGSVPEDEYKHKFDIEFENEREASEKEHVGDSAEDETDQKSDEEKPRFGFGQSDEASDADEPEEDHTEDKPSVPEVVTDGRPEPTSFNPNTGADPRINSTFQPNQAGHDGGAIFNPDKDRHADKGFDEGSFARAA